MQTAIIKEPSVSDELEIGASTVAYQGFGDMSKIGEEVPLVSVRCHGVIRHLISAFEEKTGVPAINIDFGGLGTGGQVS